MSDKIPQNKLEIKHAGLAIECGTLAVLLNTLVSQPVFVMPLQRRVSYGAQFVQQWAVHLTAKQGSVYYATFPAAEAMEVGKSIELIFPYRFHDPRVLERGNALQEELTRCLCQVVDSHPRVSNIILPARYRLPDEWVWSARSHTEQIHLHEQHWVVAVERAKSLTDEGLLPLRT